MLIAGDILVSKFGYNCTLVEFYKVLSKTSSGKSAKIVLLKSKIVNDDGYGQAGYMMPTNEIDGNKTLTKKIQLSELTGCDYIKINNYQTAYKWNGDKVWFNSYD